MVEAMRDGEALLGPDEEWAYRVLVRLGTARADEVADRMSLPPDDGRRLLMGLSDKGLAAADGADVYRPLPPEPALGTELLRRQESLEEARRGLAVLSEEYLTSARRRHADQLVEIVVGAAALRERIRRLQDSAKREMLWLCRANAVAMESAENTEEFDALDRGVRYQVIYERALLMEPGMQA